MQLWKRLRYHYERWWRDVKDEIKWGFSKVVRKTVNAYPIIVIQPNGCSEQQQKSIRTTQRNTSIALFVEMQTRPMIKYALQHVLAFIVHVSDCSLDYNIVN